MRVNVKNIRVAWKIFSIMLDILHSMDLMKNFDVRSKYKLYPLIFVGGFVSLALQIHAGRLLDIYHGGSTVTWGSVLSVFMITLGLGYYISGKRASKATLRRLLMYGLLCTISMFIPITISSPILDVGDIAYIDHPLFTSMIIYGIPSLVIGFLSPYSVEIIEERDGEAAGDIYSLSTLGSIFGALLMTFLLIPRFGIFESVIIMALMMGLSLLPLYKSTVSSYASGLFVILLLITILVVGVGINQDSDVIYQTQSEYYEIVVTEESEGERYLELSGSQSSALDLDDPDNHLYDYYDLLHTSTLYYQNESSINNALVIGGGAGVLPNRIASKYDATVDVAEIDPEVKRVAYEYFDAEREDVEWHIEDGRVFLEDRDKEYDLIMINAFKGINSVPIHLTTEEFYNVTEDSLSQNGVIATNVISSVKGKNGFLSRSVARTKDSVYPNTKFHYNEDPSDIQNVVIVSSYNNVNKSTLYSRTDTSFTGSFEADDFTIDSVEDINLGDSKVLYDSSVSEYELLAPEIQKFTSKQDEFAP